MHIIWFFSGVGVSWVPCFETIHALPPAVCLGAPWGLVIFPSGYLVLLSQDNSRAKLQDTREKLVVSLANASS